MSLDTIPASLRRQYEEAASLADAAWATAQNSRHATSQQTAFRRQWQAKLRAHQAWARSAGHEALACGLEQFLNPWSRI